MNTSAEAADQIVRMSLNGAETALRISGKGAGGIAKLLYGMLKDMNKEGKKTKGQIRLDNLLKSGKKLDIYQIPDRNLKKFCTDAKKYGILYTVLKDRSRSDGITEVMVKSEDKRKLDRIVSDLEMAPFDTEVIREDAVKQMEKEVPERTVPEKDKADEFIDKIMKKANPSKEEAQTQNPTEARNQNRNRSSRSVPSSSRSRAQSRSREASFDARVTGKGKPSVRKELDDIKKEQNKRTDKKTPQRTNEHKIPKRKKTDKER